MLSISFLNVLKINGDERKERKTIAVANAQCKWECAQWLANVQRKWEICTM